MKYTTIIPVCHPREADFDALTQLDPQGHLSLLGLAIEEALSYDVTEIVLTSPHPELRDLAMEVGEHHLALIEARGNSLASEAVLTFAKTTAEDRDSAIWQAARALSHRHVLLIDPLIQFVKDGRHLPSPFASVFERKLDKRKSFIASADVEWEQSLTLASLGSSDGNFGQLTFSRQPLEGSELVRVFAGRSLMFALRGGDTTAPTVWPAAYRQSMETLLEIIAGTTGTAMLHPIDAALIDCSQAENLAYLMDVLSPAATESAEVNPPVSQQELQFI